MSEPGSQSSIPQDPLPVHRRLLIAGEAAAAAVVLAHVVVLCTLWSQPLRAALGDFFLAVESMIAAAFLVRTAVRSRAEGLHRFAGWLLLGLTYCCIAISDFAWTLIEAFSTNPPFPSAADIIYLISYPVFFIAILFMTPRKMRLVERLNQVLDILIVLLSAALMLWVLVIAPILEKAPAGTGLMSAVTVLYPLGDFALLAAMTILVFERVTAVSGIARLLLVGSILGQIAGDSFFGFQSILGRYGSGNIGDLGYLASGAFAILAAVIQERKTSSAAAKTSRKDRLPWQDSLPFLGGFVVVFILMRGRAQWMPFEASLVTVWTIGIIAFIVVRQILTATIAAGKNIDLRASRDELDRRVNERTSRLQQANRELSLLVKVRAAPARELDLPTVLRTIVEAIAVSLGHPRVSLYLRKDDALVLQHSVGYSVVIPRIAVSQGIVGKVARTGRPILVQDSSREPDFLAADNDVASAMSAPILDHGRVSGVLSIEGAQPRMFQDADLRLLVAIAEHAAIAIERARLFAEVRESEERHRRLIETSPDGILFTDATLRIAMVNETAASILGDSQHSQLLDASVLDLVHPDDREAVKDRIGVLLREKGIATQEFRALQHDGRIIPLEARASTVTSPGGQLTGLIIVVRDITERKLFEAERSSLQEDLERRIEERTAALKESQERLRQAEKMEAVGRLAGGIAHDFNNLLTVIMGHSQMLLEEPDLPPARRADMREIFASAQRGASLTHQLLSFSRRQPRDVHSLDLSAVVEGISEMVARLVGQHIRLKVISGPALLHVEADPMQLEQLVMNLASNAADAMPGGGVLSLEMANVTADVPIPAQPDLIPRGRYVLLAVKDEGTGMPPEIQGRIFEPFYTTKALGKGTGLGLSTVYGIVKQMNGFISLESAPGKGTEFQIYFPASGKAAMSAPAESEQGPVPAGHETILVVDDQAEVRNVTAMILRNLGYTVLEAPGGIEALALLENGTSHVDLVLTDVSMPEVTGHALVKSIANRTNPPKCLFMSGYADGKLDGLVEHQDFIQKPFTTRTLAQTVRKVLDGEPPAQG
ncbi:MAG: PAS domain S-box protein [Spirochaetia bacterium]